MNNNITNISFSKRNFRIGLLKKLLFLSGFKIINEHWVYVKKITNKFTVIDLGANKGNFSEYIYNNYHAKCFAFEPNEQLFINLNEQKLHKFKYAVTNIDGPVDFFISENAEASSLIQEFQNIWDIQKKNTVEGISWKTLLTKIGVSKNQNIDILKMDIEGGEIDVINSFQKDDLQFISQITVEFHHHLNNRLLEPTKAVIQKLINHNFIGIATDISPTEILFIKKDCLQFNLIQKIAFAIYSKICFKIYE